MLIHLITSATYFIFSEYRYIEDWASHLKMLPWTTELYTEIERSAAMGWWDATLLRKSQEQMEMKGNKYYCWWFRNPANQLRLAVYPIIYKVWYILGGARFQPSTVGLKLVQFFFLTLCNMRNFPHVLDAKNQSNQFCRNDIHFTHWGFARLKNFPWDPLPHSTAPWTSPQCGLNVEVFVERFSPRKTIKIVSGFAIKCQVAEYINKHIHPWKLTWHWKIHHWDVCPIEMYVLLKMVDFPMSC